MDLHAHLENRRIRIVWPTKMVYHRNLSKVQDRSSTQMVCRRTIQDVVATVQKTLCNQYLENCIYVRSGVPSKMVKWTELSMAWTYQCAPCINQLYVKAKIDSVAFPWIIWIYEVNTFMYKRSVGILPPAKK